MCVSSPQWTRFDCVTGPCDLCRGNAFQLHSQTHSRPPFWFCVPLPCLDSPDRLRSSVPRRAEFPKQTLVTPASIFRGQRWKSRASMFRKGDYSFWFPFYTVVHFILGYGRRIISISLSRCSSKNISQTYCRLSPFLRSKHETLIVKYPTSSQKTKSKPESNPASLTPNDKLLALHYTVVLPSPPYGPSQ